MGPIEEIGLLKMDFLGLRNLDVIEDAVDIIQRSRGDEIDMEAIPLDDPKTYEMLSRGDSVGVFQLESDGMREALKQIRPTRVQRHRRDQRPLPARARCASSPTTRRGKRDPSSVTYPDDRLRPITEETYGCVHLPGAAHGDLQAARPASRRAEADDLRKAVGKKKRDLMATMKDKFLEGCAASGTERRVADDLWSLMTAAADYSFNKSHAACYALISYRTAYLKANYPAEYMAAVISSVMSTKDKVPFFVNRCAEMDIEVLPPDVNSSDHGFVVSGKSIRFGLDAVKNVGHAAVEAILGRPRAGWPVRVGLGLLRARRRPGGEQARGGVPDQVRRARLHGRHAPRDARGPGPGARERLRRRRRTRGAGQSSIFDLGGDAGQSAQSASGSRSQRPPVPGEEFDQRELLRLEKDTLGTFLSAHPLADVRDALRERVDCSLADVAGKEDGTWVTVGGIVGEAKKVRTRSGALRDVRDPRRPRGQVELFVRDAAERGRARASSSTASSSSAAASTTRAAAT